MRRIRSFLVRSSQGLLVMGAMISGYAAGQEHATDITGIPPWANLVIGIAMIALSVVGVFIANPGKPQRGSLSA